MSEPALVLMKRIDALKTPTVEEALGARWAASIFIWLHLETDSQKLAMLQSHMKAHWLYVKALKK